MKKSQICCCTKDPGGTRGAWPVVKELRRRGHEVRFIAHAGSVAVGMLKEAGEDLEELDDPEVALKDGAPKILITTMCSDGGIGRDLARELACRPGTTVVALQDYWGGALTDEWADVRPDYICVNDEFGKKITLESWSGFSPKQVVITGYPALDRFAGLDIAKLAEEAQKKLNLAETNMPTVLFGGCLESTGHAMGELVEVLNGLDQPVCFIPRLHPRMKTQAVEDKTSCDTAIGLFHNGRIIADSSVCGIEPLIAASTITITPFSTMLLEASVMRKQNISLFYEPQVDFYINSTGGMIQEFPTVTLGCSAKATNREELEELVRKALGDGLGLEEAQKTNFKIDGGNAGRVADFVASLLG